MTTGTASSVLSVITSAVFSGGRLQVDGHVVAESNHTVTGEIADDLYGQVQMDYPKFYKEDLHCKAGMLTAHVLLRNQSLPDHYRPEEIAVVLMNRSGSLDADLKYQATVHNIPSPALFVYTLPNILIGEICIRYGFKGENVFLVRESFDAELLTQTVTQLFNEGTVKVCLCGWCEATAQQHECILWLVGETNNASADKAFTTENCKTQYLNNHG
ncbi:MAG: hypothetical protein U0Y08_12235 [Bacteroidia bacterium]